MHNSGSSFLHERNPQLHASEEVVFVVDYLRADGENIPNEPAEKISAYLGFLANRDYVNDGLLTGNQASIDRQIDTHVIKADTVPEGYFDLQRRIAREQGHGDIEINSETRAQMAEAIQADQRAGLSKWAEYLGGNDGGYPDWFKAYTWNSVTKLGAYNKDKNEFQKRSRGTTAQYPEINREALAYVYDALDKTRIQGETIDGGANDAQLQKLLGSGNFGKLYAHAVSEVTSDNPELRNEIRGSWTKFNQTDDPRTARRLSGSLQGHGTGWCTAGESTAVSQLSGGDFYVYYTRDEDGKDSVPRVAIRMEQGKVAEVRGVNAAQELEPDLADITASQLKDLPGGDEYVRKAEDMKRLTALGNKISANAGAKLTSDEIRFLYELDAEIQGFGYDTDPRIKEIRALRGDSDRSEIIRLMPEGIRGQLHTAFEAYMTVADTLDIKSELVASADHLEKIFGAKDEEWRSKGLYNYLVEQLIKNGTRFTLVATPNVDVGKAQIIALAEDFGKGEPAPEQTFTLEDIRSEECPYTDSMLSGKAGSATVRLSLIPNRPDPELGYKPAETQIQKLRERQAQHPELHARVPSLLDAVTHWYNLRAHGMTNRAHERAFVNHFDLGTFIWRGRMVVLYSSKDGGEYAPRLSYTQAESHIARVAVG